MFTSMYRSSLTAMVHLKFQITAIVPKVNGLQEALPKSIGLLPFDGGISGMLLLKNNQNSSTSDQLILFPVLVMH